MPEMESIYERIKNALGPDGVLPEDFVLRQLPQEGLKFADGAMDGTIRYHMGPTKNPDISALTLVLEMASKERFKDAANALITHFNQGGMMLPVMDALQEWVYDHPEQLSPERLGQFAMTLLVQSNDVESVKFALTVLELLDQEPTPELKEILLVLAKSEELTLFCLFILGTYEDANEIFFQLAQKLKGWGKIHAISMLKPENKAMADWLLQHGWENEIMPEYSAATILKRTKLVDLLQQPEGSQLFVVAGKLIGYSLQDSPVPGLSKYKRTGELLSAYLKLAQAADLALEDYGNLFDIKDFLEAGDLAEKAELSAVCDELLASDSCDSCVKQAMTAGISEGFYLAKSLHKPFAEQALEALKSDWQNNYDLIDLLLPEKQYTDEIVSFFEEVLPLEEMATGPENEMGNDASFSEYGILSYVIQGLQLVPGKGERLICAGLYAPVIGCRNIALNTIEKWRKADFQLTEEMQRLLADLKTTEVHQQTKKRLENF